MGTCKYCGQKAGFLKSKHKECEDKYKNGKSEIIKLVESAIAETSDFNKLKSDIEKISNESFIKQEELEGLYVAGFDMPALITFLKCFLMMISYRRKKKRELEFLEIFLILIRMYLIKMVLYKKS